MRIGDADSLRNRTANPLADRSWSRGKALLLFLLLACAGSCTYRSDDADRLVETITRAAKELVESRRVTTTATYRLERSEAYVVLLLPAETVSNGELAREGVADEDRVLIQRFKAQWPDRSLAIVIREDGHVSAANYLGANVLVPRVLVARKKAGEAVQAALEKSSDRVSVVDIV